MVPFAPQDKALLPVAERIGAGGAVTPVAEVQPPTIISRLVYIPSEAVTVARPAAILTLEKLPVEYVIVYKPSGTLTNVKFMIPFAPHIIGLLPSAVRAGIAGAVIVTAIPVPEVHPPVVTDRLL